MQKPVDPILDHWYLDLDRDQTFKVVGIDERDGSVEIQYYEGAVTSYALSEWPDLNLALAARPADWTGPMDRVSDDAGHSDDAGLQAEDDAFPGQRR